MADIVTVNPDQLGEAAAPTDEMAAVVFAPGGPLQKLAFDKLLAKLISTNLCKADKASLDADLAHDADAVALVFNDPSALQNGWYRKSGASGAGAWTQFEVLSKGVKDAAQAYAEDAQDQAVLAGRYANDATDADLPGGVAGERGAKFWALRAAASLASFLASSAGLRSAVGSVRNYLGNGPRLPLFTVNRREVFSYNAFSLEPYWMGSVWPIPSSGPIRDVVATFRKYTADSGSVPLLTVNRRRMLGWSTRTNEPLWMGSVWPVPTAGPLRAAAQSLRLYTGNGLTNGVPLLTSGGRPWIGFHPTTFEPMWLGAPWPGSSAVSTTQALPTGDRPRALSSTHLRGFFVYGQSLGVGDEARGVISTAQPYANVMLIGGLKTGDTVSGMSSLVPMIEQMQAAGGAASTTSGETILSSACNYAVKLAIAAGLVSAPTSMALAGGAPGLGSQSIAQLSKGTVPYQRFIAQVTAQKNLAVASGRTYSVDLVGLIQGEQDCELGTTRAAYLAALLQLQADLDADIKAITGQTNSVRILLYQTSHKIVTSGGAVALAQMDAVKQSPYFHFVTPCWPFPRYDFVHLVAIGYNWMGKYFGRAAEQVLGEQRVPDCMRPLAAYVSNGGTRLTVRFQVPKAPVVIDTTNLPNLSNYGVVVTDASGSVAVSNFAVSGADVSMDLARAIDPATAKFRLGLDTPGTDNGRATHNFRDSTGTTVTISGTTYPLWHISAADELPIVNLEA